MKCSKEQGAIMLNLINPNELQFPNKVELTPEANLKTIQNTLRNFLAHHYDSGIKLTKNKPRNLVVVRNNGRNLAIKIANETWNFFPLIDEKDDVEQIRHCIEGLTDYKDSLYNVKLWCNSITGKTKAQKKDFPRPEASF